MCICSGRYFLRNSAACPYISSIESLKIFPILRFEYVNYKGLIIPILYSMCLALILAISP